MVVFASTRGSRRVICRAVVPAARSWVEMPGRAVRQRRGREVVRVSIVEEVMRSCVRRVWSREVE